MLKQLEQIVKRRARYDLFGREERAEALLGLMKRGGHVALIGTQASGKSALFLQAVLMWLEIEEIGSSGPALEFFQFVGKPHELIQELEETSIPKDTIPVLLVQDVPKEAMDELCTAANRALEQGISLVVEFTPAEWKSFASLQPSCAGLFMPFQVVEPDPTEMRQILLEQLRRTDESAIADFTPDTSKYTSQTASVVYPHLPEPARSLTFLNNLVSYRREKLLIGEPEPFDEAFITKCASIYTGLPRYFFDRNQLPSVEELSEALASEVVGQGKAAKKVASTLVAALAGVKPERGALASFVFTGPPASGKTAMAQAIAKRFFGSTKKFFLFDLSAMEEHSMESELFGDAGSMGLIGDALLMEPACVLCFDGIEDAPVSVRSKLVRAIQQGSLSVADAEFSLAHSVIVLTCQEDPNRLYDANEPEKLRIASILGKDVADAADTIVTFQNMGRSELTLLVKKLIVEVSKREGFIERDLNLNVDEEVVSHIVEKGLATKEGARAIPQAVEESVVVPISMGISEGTVKQGQVLHVHLQEGEPAIEVELDPRHGKSQTVELKISQLRDELEAAEELSKAKEKMSRLLHAITELDAICRSSAAPLGPVSDSMPARQEEPFDIHRQNSNRIKDARTEYDVLFDEMNAALERGDLESIRSALRKFMLFERKISRLEVEIGYFDRWDFQDALVVIRTASDSGMEWTDRIWQMYSSWASRTGRSAELLYEPSERGCTQQQLVMRIRGGFSFGYLKWEEGLHRLAQPNSSDALARVFVYPYLVGNWFLRLSTPIFVEFLGAEALKARGSRLGRIRSFVHASLPGSSEEILLQNMSTLNENRQLAREILSGIALWRRRRAPNPPQITLMRLYDAGSGTVRDQVTETEERLDRVLSGAIDRLLVERIKRLSPKRQPELPPQAG